MAKGIKRKFVTPEDLKSIACFEQYFKVKENDSILHPTKKSVLDKMLIFSADQKFKQKVEGKPWKIFRKGTITYYCIG